MLKSTTWLGYKEAMNKGGTGKCMIRVGDWKKHTGTLAGERNADFLFGHRQADGQRFI